MEDLPGVGRGPELSKLVVWIRCTEMDHAEGDTIIRGEQRRTSRQNEQTERAEQRTESRHFDVLMDLVLVETPCRRAPR